MIRTHFLFAVLSQTVTANQLSTCDQGIFPNLFPLLKIGCTLPVTSYECEILSDYQY